MPPAARCFAARALQRQADAPAAVRWAFRAAAAREPDADELGVLLERLRAEQVHFAAHPGDAAALVAAGAAPAAEDLDIDLHAAMTVVCSIILNLDEVLCRP